MRMIVYIHVSDIAADLCLIIRDVSSLIFLNQFFYVCWRGQLHIDIIFLSESLDF